MRTSFGLELGRGAPRCFLGLHGAEGEGRTVWFLPTLAVLAVKSRAAAVVLLVLYLLAPALVLPVSVRSFLVACLVPELVVIVVVVDATGDSVLLALWSEADSGDAGLHALPSITLASLSSLLLLLKTAAAACSQVGTLATAMGIVGAVEGSVVVLERRAPIVVNVIDVPARSLVVSMPISLSSLPLKTAASACAQVGTLAIAIPLIFLSASAGMLRAILWCVNRRAASSFVPWWMM